MSRRSLGESNMQFNPWSIFVFIGFALSGLLQVLILVAVFVKGGGTTGADPVVPTFPFMILVLITAAVSIWKRNSVPKVIYASALISGIFGSLLPYWLERTGALVNYERAILGGFNVMAKEQIVFPILIFALLETAVMIFSWHFTRTAKPPS